MDKSLHYARLIDEALAVLTQDQIREMADSMDLSPADVLHDLKTASLYWETHKDTTVRA